MGKKCVITGDLFKITDQDLELYKKLDVPLSILHPEERHRRKMMFRNERFLYRRACGLCKKDTMTMYSPESGVFVYCNNCWWGDSWDALEYGRDFDFARPFFEQFDDLQKKVPKYALDNFSNENSDFCNFACYNKNCYMIFGSWFNEHCMYGNTLLYSNDVMDCLYANESKFCYELIDCEKCYEVFYAQNSISCSNSYFLFDCRNCSNCLFCHNLRNKQYHIANKPVSKEEYNKAVESFLGSCKGFKEALGKYSEMITHQSIHRYMVGEQNEACTGNFLYRSKKANDVYYGIEIENVSHSLRATKGQKDCLDVSGCSAGELMYDSMYADFCYGCKFNLCGQHNTNLTYTWNCYYCEDCFGCVGLQHKKYCILNKQYSKEDYEIIVQKIIEHMKKTKHPETQGPEWGEFFPAIISPFSFNETVVTEFYPLSESEVKQRGLKLRARDKREYLPATTKLFDAIKDVPETITSEILKCEKCDKNYKIINQELAFYKKYSLPIPKECFGCRHLRRMANRPPYRSYKRSCSNCGKSLVSSYSPDRSEKVYCEACYIKELY